MRRSLRSILHVGLDLLFGKPNETLAQKQERLIELQRQRDLLEKPFREQLEAVQADMQAESADVRAVIEQLELEIEAAQVNPHLADTTPVESTFKAASI